MPIASQQDLDSHDGGLIEMCGRLRSWGETPSRGEGLRFPFEPRPDALVRDLALDLKHSPTHPDRVPINVGVETFWQQWADVLGEPLDRVTVVWWDFMHDEFRAAPCTIFIPYLIAAREMQPRREPYEWRRDGVRVIYSVRSSHGKFISLPGELFFQETLKDYIGA